MKLLASTVNSIRMVNPWAAAAIGFALPLSTAMESIFAVAAVILWFLGGNFALKFSIIRKNGLFAPVLLILAMYVIGSFYSIADWKDIWFYLSKGARILLIPFLIPLFQDNRNRQYALIGFLISAVLILFISYGLWLSIIPPSRFFRAVPGDPVVFKLHITQSLLMAFAAFLFAVIAYFNKRPIIRGGSVLLWFLMAINVFFMVSSRTGQLVLALLMLFLCAWLWRWKGAVIAVAAILAVFVTGILLPSTSIKRGTELMIREYREWTPGSGRIEESTKFRLDMYNTSIKLIKDHPVFGLGTGSFPKAFMAEVGGPEPARRYNIYNPHNEYLLILVQFGFIGLGIWLFIFFRQWRLAERLPTLPDRYMARGVVVTILAASLISSTLFDHTEGLLYFWASAVAFAPLSASSSDTRLATGVGTTDHMPPY